ncbi:14141_t:CDS:2 [Dentiscutata erythropus]|uniref:14141_t:CDS:1 n=1 Tax=Dentiscutata erythropus TaxID=1348616 RepID=A0A9N9I3A8_9GLOM|nr:14141_t:CDS:2 [Dentiscutata erythropus]
MLYHNYLREYPFPSNQEIYYGILPSLDLNSLNDALVPSQIISEYSENFSVSKLPENEPEVCKINVNNLEKSIKNINDRITNAANDQYKPSYKHEVFVFTFQKHNIRISL